MGSGKLDGQSAPVDLNPGKINRDVVLLQPVDTAEQEIGAACRCPLEEDRGVRAAVELVDVFWQHSHPAVLQLDPDEPLDKPPIARVGRVSLLPDGDQNGGPGWRLGMQAGGRVGEEP